MNSRSDSGFICISVHTLIFPLSYIVKDLFHGTETRIMHRNAWQNKIDSLADQENRSKPQLYTELRLSLNATSSS